MNIELNTEHILNNFVYSLAIANTLIGMIIVIRSLFIFDKWVLIGYYPFSLGLSLATTYLIVKKFDKLEKQIAEKTQNVRTAEVKNGKQKSSR